MKNVFRFCVCIIIFTNLLSSQCRKISKETIKNNYNQGAILSNGNYYHEKRTRVYYKGKKTNNRNLFFLKNKLKKIWNDITTSNNNYSSKKNNEKENKFNFKNALQKFTSKDNNEIINNVVINNSTVITPSVLSSLLKRANIHTVRYKDVNTIVKIIDDFYASSNYLFSHVLKYEISKDGNKKILLIYVKELILQKGSINISLYRISTKTARVPSVPSTPDLTKHAQQGVPKEGEQNIAQNEARSTSLPEEPTSLPEEPTSLPAEPTSLSETPTSLPEAPTSLSETPTSLSAQPSGDKGNVEEGENEILFERKSTVNSGDHIKDMSKYEVQKEGYVITKLKRFFEKKMNIKEKSIFVWDEKMFEVLVKSSVFNFVHVKLRYDKMKNKHILDINLMENKKVTFIPSISKSFNSFLEFCINITFAYLHSINYSDKFRLKFFQNLNYKNDKHDYNLIFLNDIVELEKLKNNFPSYSIYGINISNVHKNELNNSTLNECINVMKRQGNESVITREKREQEEEEGEKKAQENSYKSGRQSFIPLSSSGDSTQQKNIYSYLCKNKIFLFFIKRIHNTIFELKIKLKKNMFHNFLYFLKIYNGKEEILTPPSTSETGSMSSMRKRIGKLLPLQFFSFFKSKNDRVLFNSLYNIYGSKLKISSCLNACSSNLFEKSNFMKSFFNIKNKMDLVFYFNMDRKFVSTHEDGHASEKSPNLHSDLTSFFKNANNWKTGFMLGKINNMYLNYSFYFHKNYKVKVFNFFVKAKNIFIKRKGRNPTMKGELIPTEDKHVVLVPLYMCKLILNDVYLLLNIKFFFKKNLWNYKQWLSSSHQEQGKNEKNKWFYYNLVKEMFNMKTKKNLYRTDPNFDEDIKHVKVPCMEGGSSSMSTPTVSTYQVNSVNLNDAQKEYLDKMNLMMNYKLIFPVLFNNYFLNLLNLKFYLFLNCNLFGVGDGSTHISISSPKSVKTSTSLVQTNKNMDMYNYLKLNFLKSKKKIYNSAYGFGVLLSNINMFLNFKIGARGIFPSFVFQLNQEDSKFKYLS
ncbi:hypothetical protein, conserved [Plasmodium gonderi]|uniref:Protein TOC75 n=1 Tax=Plasmodium gonderi TaxID=77519 RepID=A0A1Y1JMN6_PLAGO|nr:hypothetical protein, conserved [Plasmodium gonderi]GAW83721.1 hypothetical protein, conserved [Plasmodium gonderi]